jgi:hypothetical protein
MPKSVSSGQLRSSWHVARRSASQPMKKPIDFIRATSRVESERRADERVVVAIDDAKCQRHCFHRRRRRRRRCRCHRCRRRHRRCNDDRDGRSRRRAAAAERRRAPALATLAAAAAAAPMTLAARSTAAAAHLLHLHHHCRHYHHYYHCYYYSRHHLFEILIGVDATQTANNKFSTRHTKQKQRATT